MSQRPLLFLAWWRRLFSHTLRKNGVLVSISIVAFGLIFLSLLLSLRIGLLAAGGLLLPFGVTAAITVGGASFAVFDVYFLSIGALYFARHATTRMPRAFILPIGFVLLCLLSAVVFPRLFQGLYVFPVNDLNSGTRVSSLFNSSIVALTPSSGNLSQSVYVVFGMFYVALFASIAHRAPEKIHRLLVVAAVSNIIVSGLALSRFVRDGGVPNSRLQDIGKRQSFRHHAFDWRIS